MCLWRSLSNEVLMLMQERVNLRRRERSPCQSKVTCSLFWRATRLGLSLHCLPYLNLSKRSLSGKGLETGKKRINVNSMRVFYISLEVNILHFKPSDYFTLQATCTFYISSQVFYISSQVFFFIYISKLLGVCCLSQNCSLLKRSDLSAWFVCVCLSLSICLVVQQLTDISSYLYRYHALG